MADAPTWLAPTVLLSAVGTLINFGWNIYNTGRATRLRNLEYGRTVFTAQVVAPVEASLVKLEEFLVHAKTAERSTLNSSSCTPKARAQRYEALQAETFEPARASFQVALRRAAGHSQQSGDVDWYDYEDLLDPALSAFDTLCRTTISNDQAKPGASILDKAVSHVCATVRRDMDGMVRRVGGLK